MRSAKRAEYRALLTVHFRWTFWSALQKTFVGGWKKEIGFFEKQWARARFFMKKLTAEWVRKAEADFEAANTIAKLDPSLRDPLCFHCQQTVEKYLKALLQELGQVVPRTHDLANLLNRLLKLDKTLRGLQRGLKQLTRYAVEYPLSWNSRHVTTSPLGTSTGGAGA